MRQFHCLRHSLLDRCHLHRSSRNRATSGINVAFIRNAVVVIVRVTSIYGAVPVRVFLTRVILTVLITVSATSSINVAFIGNAVVVIVRVTTSINPSSSLSGWQESRTPFTSESGPLSSSASHSQGTPSPSPSQSESQGSIVRRHRCLLGKSRLDRLDHSRSASGVDVAFVEVPSRL